MHVGLGGDQQLRLEQHPLQLQAIDGIALAAHFGDGGLRAPDLAAGMLGAVVKDPTRDGVVFREYLETVVKERDGWKDMYRACRELTK